MAIGRLIIAVVMASSFISTAYAVDGTATFYGPPLVPSSCYGFQDQGNVVAAANAALFNNRANCGRTLRIRCTGGTNAVPNPCRSGGEISVRIVDLCPGCANNQIDLSPAAFNMIGNPDAGKIRIHYTLFGLGELLKMTLESGYNSSPSKTLGERFPKCKIESEFKCTMGLRNYSLSRISLSIFRNN